MSFHIQDIIESNVEGGAETTAVARVMFKVYASSTIEDTEAASGSAEC